MFEREMEVSAEVGLHARPAAQFAEIAKSAGFSVAVGRDTSEMVNAASPLRLLTLKIKQGERILVRCETQDEEAAALVFAKLQSCIAD